MSRIPPVDRNTTNDSVRRNFDAVQKQLGAGYTDGEIAEIVAHVALNVFTNYFNRAAQTDIDFPLVTAGQLA